MKYAIIGDGGHARSVAALLMSLSGTTSILIKSDSEFLEEYRGKEERPSMVLGLGRVDLIHKIPIIVQPYLKEEFDFPNLQHSRAIVSAELSTGIGNQIHAGAFVNCGVHMIDFNVINSNSTIEHDVIMGSFNHLAPGSIVCGGAKLADQIFVGAGAIIREGVRICSKVVIGAGSVVLKDITTPGVYVGAPSRRVD